MLTHCGGRLSLTFFHIISTFLDECIPSDKRFASFNKMRSMLRDEIYDWPGAPFFIKKGDF